MPTSKKVRKIIAENEVPRVFDADCIERLARIYQLPPAANLFRFGEGVREAALLFARDALEPNVNQVNSEIAALWKAVDPATPPQWEAMTNAMEALSPRARQILVYRGSQRSAATLLPAPESLRDPERRDAARAVIVKLASYGRELVEGRSRGGGRRSGPRVKVDLFAPEKSTSPPRYNAERMFVMRLQHAWFDSTGKQAVRTARRPEKVEPGSSEILRDLGPFAQFVRECFRLVGTPEVDAVERINEVHRFTTQLASNNP